MAQNYTENDLLLYLYGELSATESEGLEKELSSNKHLQTEYENLKAGMAAMKKLEVEPSETSVNIILEYSKETAPSIIEEI